MIRITLVVSVVLSIAVPGLANVCAMDAAPAATLLFPFVVFDYNSPYGGETTMLSITNLSHEAQIMRVGFWTDLGTPFLEFNVLLVGYDVLRFNVRDVLHHGQLPVTLREPHYVHEGVRDTGPVSGDNDFNDDWLRGLMGQPESTNYLGDRCTTEQQGYPGYYTQPIPGAVLDLFEAWITASQNTERLLSSDCEPPYDNLYDYDFETWFQTRDASEPSWMYVTADVVETCRVIRPVDAEYWMPGSEDGDARYDNVLMGDAVWVSAENSTAMQAVHLEADENLGEIATENPDTGLPISFYARYSNPLTGHSDMREPLPTAWAIRYFGAHAEGFDTRVLLWKGSTNLLTPYDLSIGLEDLDPETITASICNAYTYYSWDEDSNVWSAPFWGSTDNPCAQDPWAPQACPNLFPLVVQEVPIDDLLTTDPNGWMLFVWPDSNYGGLAGAPETPDYYQTWMGVRQTAWGTHADFLPALPVANANCYSDQVIPRLGINYDYSPGRK